MTWERIGAATAVCVVTVFGCKGSSCRSGYVEEPTPAASSSAVTKSKAEEDEEEEENEEGEEDEGKEEAENAELSKPQFWRVQIVLVGKGIVVSYDKAIECGDDGVHHGTQCGPQAWTAPLVGFQPARSTLTALPAPGFRLAKWEATIHRADGRIKPRRKTSIKDFYVNYFKAPHDPADLEIVTVTFTEAPPGTASIAPGGLIDAGNAAPKKKGP